MNTPIIRERKCTWNKRDMETYSNLAQLAAKMASDPSMSEETAAKLRHIGDKCMDKAAKAGGFLSTDDFVKYSRMRSI